MRQYELVERVTSYKPDANEALLNKAYVYAMQKHGKQFRANGDPYFSHPLEVAAILTDLHLDEETIAVALLHDTIEDTDATRSEIDGMFGEKIGLLVEGLTKLKRIDLVSQKAKQAENLRRLLLAISDDIRVLLVKLADRLHNMRTLHHMKAHKRKRIAQETMEIYAPLAGRIGMNDLREELEELSFKYINPQAYETVKQHLAELALRNKKNITRITKELTARLEAEGINATVKSRQKKAWSVFRKMESKALGFEQLSDIFGFRVIVQSVEECYRALGIAHTTWSVVPGRFKDFISTAKQNDYKSIHTTVVGPGNQRVELQLRTWEMHNVAEHGVAAHALYKDGVADKTKDESEVFASLRKTIEQLAEGTNAEDFLEHTKLELFLDQVFCFSPKGRIIALPTGATPIDFAYAVHTDIGNSCVGCKINGKTMPVITELQNGDEVEIVRSKAQTPPPAWESVVKTGKARSAIRRATREAIRKQYSGLGTRILERAFSNFGLQFSREGIEESLPRLARESYQDILTDVGRGELASLDVIKAVYPDFDENAKVVTAPEKVDSWFNLKSSANMLFRMPGRKGKSKPAGNVKFAGSNNEHAIPIRGTGNELPVKFSSTGGALPGERIVGILEPGVGITIYSSKSPSLVAFDDKPELWIDVRWDLEEAKTRRFPARISIQARNEPGTLATISSVIADNDGDIQNLVMSRSAEDFMKMIFDVDIRDLNHLNLITRQLASKTPVSTVKRVIG